MLTLHYVFNLGLVFNWEIEGIWTHIHHRSCSCICKLDVRLLNHQNQTSTPQVMIRFCHSLECLFVCVQILGLVFG